MTSFTPNRFLVVAIPSAKALIALRLVSRVVRGFTLLITQRKLANSPLQLQPNANRPDILDLQWGLLAN